jgi:hypothetical protein
MEEKADTFKDIASPPTWKEGVETGIARNDSKLKVKQLFAPSEKVDTGNLYLSTIFWGISGFHTPANADSCQDG